LALGGPSADGSLVSRSKDLQDFSWRSQAFHYFGFIVFGVLALGGPSADGSLVSRSRSLQRNLEAFLVFRAVGFCRLLVN